MPSSEIGYKPVGPSPSPVAGNDMVKAKVKGVVDRGTFDLMIDGQIADLKSLHEAVSDNNKRPVQELLNKLERLKKTDVVRSFSPSREVISSFSEATEDLKRSIMRQDNVLRQLAALRQSEARPDAYGEDSTMGNVNEGALSMIRGAASNPLLGGMVGENVIGNPIGSVNEEMVERIKSFGSQPFMNNPSSTYRRALREAVKSSNSEVNREVRRCNYVLDNGKDVNYATYKEADYKVSRSGNVAKMSDAALGGLGKYGRYLAKKSGPADSWRYDKFLKHRDETLQKLVRELRVGGLATDMLNFIERSIHKSISECGTIDPITYNTLMELISHQKRQDKEGIADKVMEKINSVVDDATTLAQKHADNEDSQSSVRSIRLLLMASALLGFPLLGPILSGFTSSILGSGVAEGAVSLMSADLLGPFQGVASGIGLDHAAEFILTEVPVISDGVELLSFFTDNELAEVLGVGATSLAGSPLVPLIGAAAMAFYCQGDTKYNKKQDNIRDNFKYLQKDRLDAITKEFLGSDTKVNVGGELADKVKREEFLKEKHNLLKKGDKIRATTNFIDIVNDCCQSSFASDNSVGDIMSEVFSPELLQFLRENGLGEVGTVPDESSLRDSVARLHYGHEGGDAIRSEMQQKFGLFAYVVEELGDVSNEEKVARFREYLATGPDSYLGVAKSGDEIFDARHSVLAAVNDPGSSLDQEDRAQKLGLLTTKFSDLNEAQRASFVADLKAAASESDRSIIAGHSDYMAEAIEKGHFDEDLFPGGAPASPSVSVVQKVPTLSKL